MSDDVTAGLGDRASTGPFDESEANPVRPYIDLGGIKVLPREGLNLRLEVEEQTKRIVAVGLDYAESTLQVQPFAAPRSSGLWDETRDQIRQQIRQQGGRAVPVSSVDNRRLEDAILTRARQLKIASTER